MLADNLVHFSRILRDTGMAVGPDRVLAAIAAVEAVGLERREDVRAALAAVMLERHEQQTMFDAAFDAFFRDPKLLEQMMVLLLPKAQGRGEKVAAAALNRLAEALAAPPRNEPPRPEQQAKQDQIRFETEFSFSERERLQQADFESMSTAEYELAKQLAERAPLPVHPVRRRRHEGASRGTPDLRRSLRQMVRQPETLSLAWTQPRVELPPLVVLLDISGSMDRYSRLFLHYVHGLTRRHLKVHTFTFGTRLTNITRCLRHRDPDVALKLADAQVHDWKGGTRIASSLDEFNRRWARRVLGGNAAVLLVTDGLERDEGGLLARAAAQLHRSAHELVWLNPLLRFDGFQPRAAGVRALLAHVDRFLPVHSLASLADLGRALRRPALDPLHCFTDPRIHRPTMELKGERLIPAPIEKTWAALNDPGVLKGCITGCESLERSGDDAFAALVAVKVGPVSAKFKGNLKMLDVKPPTSYTIQFDGQGGVAGFGKGSADVLLAAEGTQTRLSYVARAQVGGKMAQVGSRLIDAAAGKITEDFFTAFEAALKPAAAEQAPAPAVAEAKGNNALWWAIGAAIVIAVAWWLLKR